MKLKKGMITEEANGEFVAVATGEASKSFNGLIRNNATAFQRKLQNVTSIMLLKN